VSVEFRNWIVTHIEGEEEDKRIVERLKSLDGERLERAISYLFKLGYIEEKEWKNEFW